MNLGNPRGGSGSAPASPGATLPGVTSWNPSGIPAPAIIRSIAVSWSVPAFQFGHASVGPRPSDNGCQPALPSRWKGTACDTVTGIVQCSRLGVGKDRLVACTDLARSGCYRVGPIQGQATSPSLSHKIQPCLGFRCRWAATVRRSRQ
jgi:hypothetical protein